MVDVDLCFQLPDLHLLHVHLRLVHLHLLGLLLLQPLSNFPLHLLPDLLLDLLPDVLPDVLLHLPHLELLLLIDRLDQVALF